MATSIWHLSNTTQLRKGVLKLAIGARVQFFRANTTTPLTVFRDALAASPHNAADLKTDGDAVWPAVFVPYGSYDYRVLDNDGTIITTAEAVPNPEPVDSTATDPDALLQTGDVIWKPSGVSRSGFVRCNGRTIGPSISAATERANDDSLALYTWLWNNLTDIAAPVIGGRGASASADWSAGKPVTLPDMRGSGPLGLDGMGNSGAGRLDSTPVEIGGTTTGGSVIGGNTQHLLIANLPAHDHGVDTIAMASVPDHVHGAGTLANANDGGHSHTATQAGHQHTYQDYRSASLVDAVTEGAQANAVVADGLSSIGTSTVAPAITVSADGGHSHTISGATAANGGHSHALSGATATTGGSVAPNNVSRSILGTWLIKL